MDCTEAVYSNDYYDLIVDNRDRRWEDILPPCVQEIDSRYTIGYWNREGLPPFHITNFTYPAVPKILTTLDERAMEASNILQIQNQPTLSLKGQGVLVGVIDTGIDYRNPVFQNPDGTTRIVSIWDQTIEAGPAPEGFLYGAEYPEEQINQALTSPEPAVIVPSQDTDGHGTYVASLAAGGASPENSFIGAAPYADIAVVKLKEAKEYLRDFFFVRRDALAFQENDVMAGMAYLNQLANERNMPLVLCVSVGTNSGSHGGNSPLSNLLETMFSKRFRTAVIAAGNEADKRHHFYSTIRENDSFENVEINVGEDVSGFTAELWFSITETFTVEIVSPTGERIPRLSRQAVRREYTFIFENTTVTIDKNITFSDSEFQIIFFRFENPTQGIWNIRVYAEDVISGVFELWLPMQALLTGDVFFLRSNPDTTITVPGNAGYPITVGGYDARNDSIYLDSGRGYTIDGIIKPDIVAPAVEVIGAGLRNRFVAGTGTSAAAAITTGAVALLMEWAVVRGNYTRITASDIKSVLIRGAARDTRRLYPNREWGYGRLDLYGAFNTLRTI